MTVDVDGVQFLHISGAVKRNPEPRAAIDASLIWPLDPGSALRLPGDVDGAAVAKTHYNC